MSAMPMNSSVISYRVNEVVQQDAGADVGAQSAQLDSLMTERQALNRNIRKLEEKAAALRNEAERLQAQAGGANFFEKIFGDPAAKAKEAAEKSHQAEMARAQANEAKEAGNQAGKSVERMQQALESIQRAHDDIDQMGKMKDRLQAATVRLD